MNIVFMGNYCIIFFNFFKRYVLIKKWEIFLFVYLLVLNFEFDKIIFFLIFIVWDVSILDNNNGGLCMRMNDSI